MTCIVGYIGDNGTIYMGADSAATGDCDLYIIKDSKVFIKGDMIIGVSGSVRTAKLVKYNFIIPKDIRDDVNEYFALDFIPELRVVLEDGGALKGEDGMESSDSWLLIGYKGRLFTIDSDFQVIETVKRYRAVGCGSDLALGCIYGLEDLMNAEMIVELSPESKIEMSLRASQAYNCHVKGPFCTLELGLVTP